MTYIISALWVCLELLYGMIFSAAFLTAKRDKKHFVFIFLLAWIVMYVYTNFNISELVKPIFTVTVLAVVSAHLYHGKLLTHVCLSVLSYIFIAIIDTGVAYGASIVLQVSVEELIWLKFSYITIVTIGKLMEIFFAWLLLRVRSRRTAGSIENKWLLLTVLFPIVSVIMLILVFLNSQKNEDLSLGAVIYSAILAVANIAILYIIHSIEESTRREQDMILLKKQIGYQTECFSSLEKNYRNQRKATHEFEKHLRTLSDLLNQGDYDTAQDYIQHVQGNRMLRIFNVNSRHPVVDVVLNQKYQEAKAHSIKMQIKVNDLSKISIQSDALVVMLANLLDNAIEACDRLTERKEIMCSVLADDMLHIAIRNTSAPVEIIEGVVTTTKPGKLDHGYGIPAVRYILDSLNAEYAFDYSEGWFQFVAEITI